MLVDADLRRPNLHRILNCANDAGLRQVLGNIRSLDAALQEVGPGLSLLSSGQIGSDPQALLLMNGLEETLRALEQRFDIVLLDSPPVLAVADGTLLAPHVGGVVVAVRSGTTTTGELRLVRERVIGAGGSLIGCVLSHVSPEDSDDYHPYASDYATPGGVAE